MKLLALRQIDIRVLSGIDKMPYDIIVMASPG
jgi:hypothetical protein